MKEQILKAYNFRYACKKYDETKKITDSDFETIIETGRLSPSSFGWEPWQFVVVESPELREKLVEVTWGAQNTLPTASHFVIFLARKKRDVEYDSEYLKYMAKDVQKLPEDIQEMKLDFFKNFIANDFDVNTEREAFDWSSKQTYIALGNMLTTAAMLEIDSQPIEGFHREKVEELLEKEGVLDRDAFGVSVMASFGYRSDDAEIFPKTRRDAKEVIKYV